MKQELKHFIILFVAMDTTALLGFFGKVYCRRLMINDSKDFVGVYQSVKIL